MSAEVKVCAQDSLSVKRRQSWLLPFVAALVSRQHEERAPIASSILTSSVLNETKLFRAHAESACSLVAGTPTPGKGLPCKMISTPYFPAAKKSMNSSGGSKENTRIQDLKPRRR